MPRMNLKAACVIVVWIGSAAAFVAFVGREWMPTSWPSYLALALLGGLAYCAVEFVFALMLPTAISTTADMQDGRTNLATAEPWRCSRRAENARG